MIRIWQSYSCNNSSSYRLVARFTDAGRAKDIAAELAQFFDTHSKEMDARGGYVDDPSEASKALAVKYGFEWRDYLGWGDDYLEGDQPSVSTDDHGVLVVWHTYCGGFGEVSTYLERAGAAVVEPDDTMDPCVSVLFRVPKGPRENMNVAVDEVTKMFANLSVDDEVNDFTGPWLKNDRGGQVSGPASYFCDGDTIGFCIPCDPTQLGALKAWLSELGVEDPSIRLCNYGDREKFADINAARCTACASELKYLDPRTTEIATEQLACAKCGGMFDLATFPTRARSSSSS